MVTVSPDGGWGWVVALFSMLVMAHTNGLMLSMSVMYVSWLEEFGQSRGATSWVISIAFAAMFGLGPLGASLATHIGFRATTVVGGLFTASGFILSYFATSVSFLVVSIGLVSGVGCALAYFSAVAVVAAYFTSRLSVAMGIIYSGVGIGAFTTAPLLNYLTELYGWRGSLLVVGALSFHVCLYGLFFRPLRPSDNSNNLIEIKVEEIDDETISMIQKQQDETGNDDKRSGIHSLSSIHNESSTEQEVHGDSKSASLYEKCILSDDKLVIVLPQGNHSVDNGCMPLLHNRHLDVSNGTGRPLNSKGSLDRHLNMSSDTTTSQLASTSLVELRGRTSSEDVRQRRPWHKTSEMSLEIMFARSFKHLDTIALSGSINNLIRQVETPLIKEFSRERLNNGINSPTISHQRYDTENAQTTQTSFLNRQKQIVLDTIHRNILILKDRTFLLFAINNFLTCLSYVTPIVYLFDRALDQGLDEGIGTMLVSINGLGSIVGRILFGFVTYRLFPDRLTAYIFVLAMAGIATILSPLCGSSPILHGIYSALVGVFIGGYCTLCAVTCIDLMGTEKGIESFGLLLTFQGVSSLLGPPLGGLLFDLTQTYLLTYVMLGLFLVLSVVILLPMGWRRRRKARRASRVQDDR